MRTGLRRFFRERSAVVGVVIVSVVVLAAIFGPLVYGVSPIAIRHDLMGTPQAPSAGHLLGTDLLGRDEFSRALYGARVSLTVGVTAMLVAIGVGTLYGAVSGAAGGASSSGSPTCQSELSRSAAISSAAGAS